jgi:NAD(P)-dependent dehydrogenase (short-subunit alcohol dehydrogenase family)
MQKVFFPGLKSERRWRGFLLMKEVSVITGGSSGMGFATAKLLGKNQIVLLAGRDNIKLQKAASELRTIGIKAEGLAINVGDRNTVDALAERAIQLGGIASVIHCAGMSPHMGEAREIMVTNALGTINVNEAFYRVMEAGSCLIDVSSTAAYLTPNFILPKGLYKYSRIDKILFMKKMMARVNLFPRNMRSGMAYTFSKNFINWYAKTDTVKFAEKGIRILSVSPGNFDTPMGKLEHVQAEKFTRYCAMKRLGHADEIAHLFAFLVSDKLSYLTGADIICDGGLVASGIDPVKVAYFG